MPAMPWTTEDAERLKRIEQQLMGPWPTFTGDARKLSLVDFVRETHREMTKRWPFISPSVTDTVVGILGKLARGEVPR